MDLNTIATLELIYSLSPDDMILTCAKGIYNDSPFHPPINYSEQGMITPIGNNHYDITFDGKIIKRVHDINHYYDKFEIENFLKQMYHHTDYLRWKPNNIKERIIRDFFVNREKIQYAIEKDFKFIAGILENQDLFKIQYVFSPR